VIENNVEGADVASWQAYGGHRLDQLEARWRATGPNAAEPELRLLFTALDRIAPKGADFAALGRQVFAAIRDAERDARAAGELRRRARTELAELADLMKAFDRLPDILDREAGDDREASVGLIRTSMLLDYRGAAEVAKGLEAAADWLRGANAAKRAINAAREA
jgi:hypothetical protein